MWGSKISPRPLTAESLKTIEQRRLAQERRGIHEPLGGTKKSTNGASHPDTRFCAGTPLPKHMRMFYTPDMMNIPIEDFDPFYAETKTFVVVTANKTLHRFSANPSLNLFSPFNPIRRTCIALLHNWMYRWFMIIIAFLDCISLIQSRANMKDFIFHLFGTIYAFDFVVNVTAKGLIFGPFTFLRDGWGWIDLGLLLPYFILPTGGYHVFSGLRALKIVSLIQSLKSAVEVVWRIIADMRDILIWTLFTTWIFAIIGMQLYVGVSSQKCVRDFPEDDSVGTIRDMKWLAWVSNTTNWVEYYVDHYVTCGNYSLTQKCIENYTCLQVHGKSDRLYNSIGRALMTTTQLMQRDSWDDIFHDILQHAGPWHVIYFVVTIFLGSFYTLNMLLAVISKSYDELQKERQLVDKLEQWEYSETSSKVARNETSANDSEPNHLHPSNSAESSLLKCVDYYCKNPIKKILKGLGILINVIAFDPFTELIMAVATVANLILLSMEHFRMEENLELYTFVVKGYEMLSIMFALDCLLKFLASGPKSYFSKGWNLFDFSLVVLYFIKRVYENTYLKLLASLRSFRVFKLAELWPTLNTLVGTALSSLGNVSGMTLVAIGIFYMFCVGGVILFRRDGVNASQSSWHFGDFWHAFMVMFRLLCGDWTEPMWECFEANGPICIPFFYHRNRHFESSTERSK